MNTESRRESPVLGQLLDVMTDSSRIVIYDGEDEKSPELYRGFVACFIYEEDIIDKSRRIAKVGLGTEIFKVENHTFNSFVHTRPLGEEVPVENISNFVFSDLEEIIYTRIFLEAEG